ncbi:MAG: hypothetical protein OEZ57_12915 [Nitrospirota bacterium]|nr:hypothetical protein [Nitrospirota bacterium]MDH5585017.1 hypothetical protein [Nitrospirota bacterium]MDH5775800.1 hypothetical protein [Nitrospirota bacterium]
MIIEYQYEIQCRVEALAHIAMTSNSMPSCFCSDGISFSHWDMGTFRDDTFWLAKVIIKAENLNDAITCFNLEIPRQLAAGFFIKSSKNKTLDLKEVLSELNKKGIEELEEYEWVDDEELTENY